MINKAVILAAGLGTRFLPIAKTFPKEILPLVDKPVIQYLIEEAVASGIKGITLVLSPEKEIIKDYFSANKKLEYFLKQRGKVDLLKEVRKINNLARLSYVYQRKPLGIGDAILCAEKQIQNQPFALFFADDVISSRAPCLKQMLKVYQQYQQTVLAVCRVPWQDVPYYGIVKVKKIKKSIRKPSLPDRHRGREIRMGTSEYQRVSQVLDLIEKPSFKEVRPWSDSDSGRSLSNLAIVGRYILTPDIFPALKKLKSQPLRPGQEIYLTDALKILLGENIHLPSLPRIPRIPIYAYEYQGKWLSCGNKIGWLKANIEIGLKHPEVKKDLKKYLENLC